MKVKELIKALEQCNPEAEVYTEGANSNNVYSIAEYTKKDHKAVYIGDCMTYIDDALVYEGEFAKRSIA